MVNWCRAIQPSQDDFLDNRTHWMAGHASTETVCGLSVYNGRIHTVDRLTMPTCPRCNPIQEPDEFIVVGGGVI